MQRPASSNIPGVQDLPWKIRRTLDLAQLVPAFILFMSVICLGSVEYALFSFHLFLCIYVLFYHVLIIFDLTLIC